MSCAKSLLFVCKSKIVLRSRSASQAGIHGHIQPPVHLITSYRGIPLSRPLSLSSYLGYQCTMDVSFPDGSSSKSISVWAKQPQAGMLGRRHATCRILFLVRGGRALTSSSSSLSVLWPWPTAWVPAAYEASDNEADS